MKKKEDIKKKINKKINIAKKKTRKAFRKYKWIVIFIISIIFAMWIYGMAGHYFPEPVHVGAGQYFDIAAGITIIGLILVAVLITIIFRKKKKEIGGNEYTVIKRS